MNSEKISPAWFEIRDPTPLPTPCLLIYRSRVQQNLQRMISLARGVEHVRPHIKTHKMRELIEMQRTAGITKFKCATIAEAELAASVGVSDVLLAYQPVGPAPYRVAALAQTFPATRFSVACDDAGAVRALSQAMASVFGATQGKDSVNATLEVLLDIDVGQHRTGIPADSRAEELYRTIVSLPYLQPGGLHAYDGHLSDPDPVKRAAACDAAFLPVAALRSKLQGAGLSVPRIVAGGTPTFPIHARRGDVECSPGTCVLWDAGYATKLRDLDFLPAALLLTRVISRLEGNRLCLDLGHKAVASEMPPPRVQLLGLEDTKLVLHSEEHLVIETARAREFNVGDCLYGIPWHICPTVALHSEALVVQEAEVIGTWKWPPATADDIAADHYADF